MYIYNKNFYIFWVCNDFSFIYEETKTECNIFYNILINRI